MTGAGLLTGDGRIGAVLLAAGASRRFGQANKLLIPIEGKPLIRHSLHALQAAGLTDIIVVIDDAAGELEATLALEPVTICRNKCAAEGMASSLSVGAAAVARNSKGLLIALADMPFIRPSTLRTLLDRFIEAKYQAIVRPTYRGRAGHPVIFPAPLRASLVTLKGDSGGASIIRDNIDLLVEVPVEDPGVCRDIDRPEDL